MARVRDVSDWIGFVVFLAWSILLIGLIGDAVKIAPTAALLLLPSILCELVVALAFLIRRPARDRIVNWRSRAAAHGGAFLVPTFFAVAQKWRPDWVQPSGTYLAGTGGLLWLAGTVLCVWTIWNLRLAFSIEPQARELITSGPYRWVRHPIYASYFLQYGGLWITRVTPPFTLVLGIWVILMLARMRYEERVLSRAFPEYGSYRQKAGLLVPRLRAAVSAATNGTPSGSLPTRS